MNKLLVGGVLGFLWASSAFAQCATGVDTGGGNCIPPDANGMPGSNAARYDSAPPQPAPVWIDQWGAIVADRGTGQAGVAVNKDSKTDAVNAAMHDCQMRGSPNCVVLLTYYNQCAALAIGDGGSGLSHNPTIEGARNGAMRTCSEDSTTCKIVYSACSVQRRIN
jgi:hypothetical protein